MRYKCSSCDATGETYCWDTTCRKKLEAKDMDEEQYGQFINRSELKTERMRNALLKAREYIIALHDTWPDRTGEGRERLLDLIREAL